jgi:hypothetical protein
MRSPAGACRPPSLVLTAPGAPESVGAEAERLTSDTSSRKETGRRTGPFVLSAAATQTVGDLSCRRGDHIGCGRAFRRKLLSLRPAGMDQEAILRRR